MNQIPATCLDLVQGKGLSFVTTVRPDGLLSVHPISVLWQDGHVRFSTLKSRGKYRNLLRDARVSLCIPDPGNIMRYVEIRGRASLADDRDRAFINAIARHFMNVPEYPYDAPGDERVTVTLEIEQVWAPGERPAPE
jgi:PPOX class probable F420-dependent enzyme